MLDACSWLTAFTPIHPLCWFRYIVMESLSIRKILPGDAAVVARLMLELGYRISPEDLLRNIERQQRTGLEQAFVAELNGNLLGVVGCSVVGMLHQPELIGRMTTLVVTEQARGKRVGRALVECAEQYFSAHGCSRIEVTSNRTREAAHRFYLSLGYMESPKRFIKTLTG